MAMNRMDRIVLDPIRTYACTRTARPGVRVTVVDELEEDELEEDEVDDDLALDVVTELMEEFKASSASSRGSSVALLPLKENASFLTSFKTSASVFPEGTPFLISLINMTGVKY